MFTHLAADRWRHGSAATALVAAAILTAGALALPVGATAQIPPPGPPPFAGEPIDPDAVAAFNWSVPERWEHSGEQWNRTRATYNPNFITPSSWPITLDACGSRAVRRIERYTFVITGVTDPSVTRTLNSQTCKGLVALPSLGLYRVEVTVHTALGASVTVPSIVKLRDYLIVSIGDSLASGEGAPDRLGSYGASVSVDFSGVHFETHTNRAVRWQDRRCHRSTRSGPAQAAKEIEDASRHTSVTFVSFACSGADIKHLDHVSYAGAEPPPADQRDLPPQIIAVRQLLNQRARGLALRQIDALLVTGGINDLSFSGIIKRCLKNNNRANGHTSCVYGSDGAHLVNTLRFKHRYDALAAAVSFWLPNAREKYINDYPRQVFKGGACGAFGKHGPRGVFGIEHTEGEAMNVMGIALNRQVEGMTIRHAGEGWHYIGGVTAKFEPHAYCADFPWFNHVETSLAKQGDVEGTAHPNRAGHFFYSHLLRRAIVLGK